MSKAVLLLNLGTPAAPTSKGLRDFYKHFFNDPFVFDMNPVGRWLLRNLIILPFRAPVTAKKYASIWMDEGSPLKVYADRLQQSLQAALDQGDEDVLVLNAMAYSNPFIADVMAELEQQGRDDILLIPMFPQYSTATTASVFHAVKQAAEKWSTGPKLHFVDDLFSEAAFIRAWSILLTRHLDDTDIDHVIFSYHGLPEKTLQKADAKNICKFGECCTQITESNRYCYRAQCIATTHAIVQALGWEQDHYSIAFQSRFGRQRWIQPYLDEHLVDLVEQGKKKVAVVTPSFISDCLETTHEIGIEYNKLFIASGGEVLNLVPNLNGNPSWFSAMKEIVSHHLGQSTESITTV